LVRGAGDLGALAASLDGLAAPLGFERETRPFRPHVTLGRVRAPRPAPDLRAALETQRDASFGSWTPAAVVLMESRLGPAGARYWPVGQWAFAARASGS
jgi:2'-5' RNA ligase